MATSEQRERLKVRLRALSPEARQEVARRVSARQDEVLSPPKVREPESKQEDVLFPYEPENPAMVIPRQLGNIVSDAPIVGKNFLEMIAELGTEPVKELMGPKLRETFGLKDPKIPRLPLAIAEMSRAFQGSGQALLGEDTRNAQAARDAVSGVKSQLDPKFVAEHPVQSVQNMLGAIGGMGRVMGLGGRSPAATGIALRAEAADPINATLRGTGKLVSETVKRVVPKAKLDVIVTEALGVTTGMESSPIREAFLAGFEGNLKTFRDFLKDRKGQKDFLQNTNDAMLRIRDEVDYESRFGALNPSQQIIDIRSVKSQIKNDITSKFNGRLAVRDGKWVVQLNKGPSTISRKHRPAVKRELEDILNRPDKMSMRDLDAQKRELGDISMKSSAGGKAISSARTAVRDKLHENADYAELAGDYDKVMDVWDEANDALSITPSDAKRVKTPANQLKGSLREGRDIERGAIEVIEESADLPMRASIAGLNLSQTPPKGLIGRAMIAGTSGALLASLVAGLDAGPAVVGGLLGMTMTLPRTVGSIMSSTGATARQAKRIIDFSSELEKTARQAGISTGALTHAQIISRLQDQGDKEPKKSSLQTISNMENFPFIREQ
jgi:hypothetical protein